MALLQEKVAHFYQRFVACRNFKIWMARQQAAAVAWQERAWQRAELEHGIQARIHAKAKSNLTLDRSCWPQRCKLPHASLSVGSLTIQGKGQPAGNAVRWEHSALEQLCHMLFVRMLQLPCTAWQA